MAEQDFYVYRKKGRKPEPFRGPVLILFVLLLFGFSLLNLFWPKRTTLELENRNAAQFPAVTAKALASGQWFSSFSTYLQDQIAFRDQFINLECAVNEAVFQKTEESGMLIGKDHWLFTKLFNVPAATSAQLEKNITSVASFASRYPGHVTFMLAPSASVIYPELLPAGAPMIDEDAMLDDIFSRIGAEADVIDLRGPFTSAKDQYLYYKTDHHWTTHGAYLAYQQFCARKGLTPFDLSQHKAIDIPGFEGTHYSSTRLWNVQDDTLTYYPLDNPMTIYQITGEAQFSPSETSTLMNPAKLETRDKYGAFLGGNNGYSVIEGNGQGSILVVKDSYANCFVPFLTENYAKIGVVDFRGFAYGLDSTIKQEGYDEILVLYNFQTFIADNKVIYIDRPTTLS